MERRLPPSPDTRYCAEGNKNARKSDRWFLLILCRNVLEQLSFEVRPVGRRFVVIAWSILGPRTKLLLLLFTGPKVLIAAGRILEVIILVDAIDTRGRRRRRRRRGGRRLGDRSGHVAGILDGRVLDDRQTGESRDEEFTRDTRFRPRYTNFVGESRMAIFRNAHGRFSCKACCTPRIRRIRKYWVHLRHLRTVRSSIAASLSARPIYCFGFFFLFSFLHSLSRFFSRSP